MTYRTHAATGAAMAAAVMWATGQPLMPIAVAIAAFGALLPDIDHPDAFISTANPVFMVFGFLARLLLKVMSLAFNLVIGPLRLMGVDIQESSSTHRGPLTHSLFGTFLFAAFLSPLLIWVPVWWYAALIIGIFSHIVADSFNPSGILWFWPITKGKHRLIPEFMSLEASTDGNGIALVVSMVALLGFMLMAAQGNGVGMQDATKLYPPAASMRFDFAGGGGDAAVPVADLPKSVMRMPDGSLWFADGSSVTQDGLDARGITADIERLGQKTSGLLDPIVGPVRDALKPQ